MDFKGKITAFDLDGTLTESNQIMRGDMALIIFELLKKARVAIITGASFSKMKEQLQAIFSLSNFMQESKSKENLYMLPTNGLLVYEYRKESDEWVNINKNDANLKNKEKIIKALNEIIESKKFSITEKPKGKLISDRGNQISLALLGEDASLAEKKIFDPDHKKREEIKAELLKNVSDIDVVIGGNTTIDILPKGFNKGVGLTNFQKILGISSEDMVFAGDAIFPGGNDYSAKEAGIESIKVDGPQETAEIIKGWLA